MVCYYHPSRQAVGICKHCQRGLCTDCVEEVDDILACKNRCEGKVHAINQLVERNLLQARRLESGYLRGAIFYFMAGAAFVAFGAYEIRWLGLQGIFLLLIGLFLLYAAVTNFIESRKY